MSTGSGEVLNDRASRGTTATKPEAVTPMHGFEDYVRAHVQENYAILGANRRAARMYPAVMSGEYQKQFDARIHDIAPSALHTECWQVFRASEDNVNGLQFAVEGQGKKVTLGLSPFVSFVEAVSETGIAATLGVGADTVTRGAGNFAVGDVGRVIFVSGAGIDADNGWYLIDSIDGGAPGPIAHVKQVVTGTPASFNGGAVTFETRDNTSIYAALELINRTWEWDASYEGPVPLTVAAGALVLEYTGTAASTFYRQVTVKLRWATGTLDKPTLDLKSAGIADICVAAYSPVASSVDGGSISRYGQMEMKLYDSTHSGTASAWITGKTSADNHYFPLSAKEYNAVDKQAVVFAELAVTLHPNGPSVTITTITCVTSPGVMRVDLWDFGATASPAFASDGHVRIPDGFVAGDAEPGPEIGMLAYVSGGIPIQNGLHLVDFPFMMWGVSDRVNADPQGKLTVGNYYAIRLFLDLDRSPSTGSVSCGNGVREGLEFLDLDRSPNGETYRGGQAYSSPHVYILGHYDDAAPNGETYRGGQAYSMGVDGNTLTAIVDGGANPGRIYFAVLCNDEVVLKDTRVVPIGLASFYDVAVEVIGPDRELGVANPSPELRRMSIERDINTSSLDIGLLGEAREIRFGDELKHRPVVVPKGGHIILTHSALGVGVGDMMYPDTVTIITATMLSKERSTSYR